MDLSEYPQPDEITKRPDEGPRLGAFLKEEREKRGLDHARVTELTRLRPYILDALENEEWERLPSPVFVKGFLRSYARALGLQDGKVVGLYEQVAPSEAEMPEPPVVPSGGKSRFLLLSALALVFVVSGFYVWRAYSPEEGSVTPPGSFDTPKIELGRLKLEKEYRVEEPMTESVGSNQQPEPAPASETDREASESIPDENETSEDSSVGTVVAPPEKEMLPAPEEPQLNLRANVKERTWIRIVVDDEAPKEYIFSPGSRPEWKAERGFEILIGNAGGLGLEYNGKEFNNLGNPGQVVLLRFPEDYRKRSTLE